MSYDIIIIADYTMRWLGYVKLGWILVQIIPVYIFFVNAEATFQHMEYKRIFLKLYEFGVLTH